MSAVRDCDWCPKSLTTPAADACVNPEHRASDLTLGVRDAPCGCCYVVDKVALNILRELTEVHRA